MQVVERNLRELAPESEITFERIAVNPNQIIAMALLTRPTKKTDSRAKGFQGESVEVDAIPPATLKNLVEVAIVNHVDINALGKLEVVEQSERQILSRMVTD
jgi:hypothetical protein